ncbi:MAG TPA: DUF6326 family protein [Candidatus Acidoferrum sp.]|nr:DUF6326 family protein [Candidatus Acidoferrum sp.]
MQPADEPPRTAEIKDRKGTLSTLWIFAMLNYIYADVLTLTDVLGDPNITKKLGTGYVGGVHVTPGSLLAAAILMETAIAMVLLSRILKYRANRWSNIIVAVIHTAAVFLSFFVGGIPSQVTYYTFFAAVEILCTLFIVWYAWTWPNLKRGTPNLQSR